MKRILLISPKTEETEKLIKESAEYICRKAQLNGIVLVADAEVVTTALNTLSTDGTKFTVIQVDDDTYLRLTQRRNNSNDS